METATCSPTTADEKYMCNQGRGGAFLNGRVWDTFILFAMHVTLLYKTESNNLKKMDGEKKKGARKQICFQICTPRAGGGGSNSETQSKGGPGHRQPVFTAGMALMEPELQGGRMRDSPGPLHGDREHRVPQWYAMAMPRRDQVSAVGCPWRQGGEGWGGSGDVFKCISLYICSLNAYGTGRQSIWALHNN